MMKTSRSSFLHLRSFIIGFSSTLILLMLFINVIWTRKLSQPQPSTQQPFIVQPNIKNNFDLIPANVMLDLVLQNCHLNHCVQTISNNVNNCISSPRKFPENRIITFSMYILEGKDPQWLLYGILQNYDAIKIFYPGWKMRVYHNKEVHPGFVEYFESLGIEMVAKDFNPQTPTMGMFWRFLVADDPTVDRFIVRDLDSRFSLRELHAVNEWIASGKSFHAMRDNPSHGVAILGGMWGGTRDMLKRYNVTMQQLQDEWPWKAQKGQDQSFLENSVWPLVQSDALVHDAHSHPYCGVVPCQYFPTQYKNPDPTFVGQTIDHDKTVRCFCNLTLYEPDTVASMLETEQKIKNGMWVSSKQLK